MARARRVVLRNQWCQQRDAKGGVTSWHDYLVKRKLRHRSYYKRGVMLLRRGRDEKVVVRRR